MKIGLIINSLKGGGAERVVQTLSNFLVKENEIHIICLDKNDIAYDLNPDVQVHFLRSGSLSVSFGKVLMLPIQAIEIYFLLKKLKIDKAISFLVRANIAHSIIKIFKPNRNVIISERNYSKIQYSNKSVKSYLMTFLIKKFYPKADKIIAISEGVRNSLVDDYRLSKDKISVIYNPQDLGFIRANSSEDSEYKFISDYKYIVTSGRLTNQKDHKTLISAFGNLNNKKTKLLILGEGELKKELTAFINSQKLNERVELLGFVKNPFALLAKADVFVLSSKFEGFGNVIVEAMACGLPVVSTNCFSGPSEILQYGNAGLLTNVGAVNELTSAMESMLSDNKNELFSKKSEMRALDFDVKNIAKLYLKSLIQ